MFTKRWGIVVLLLTSVAGCGGGDSSKSNEDNADPEPPTPELVRLKDEQERKLH